MAARKRFIVFGILLAALVLVLCLCVKPESEAGYPEGLEGKTVIAGNASLADKTKESAEKASQLIKTETATFALG
jgi:hypothetical protein